LTKEKLGSLDPSASRVSEWSNGSLDPWRSDAWNSIQRIKNT